MTAVRGRFGRLAADPGFFVFVTLFLAHAYFHQGGGWNQNARFDQVRSIAEAGEMAIDRFAIYRLDAGAGSAPDRLRRIPFGPGGTLPFAGAEPNSYDLAFHGGSVYPNKPPGTTLLAVPAYWALFQVERAWGGDPDRASVLTRNVYLTTLFSVGLTGALGGWILYRVMRRLLPELRPASAAAAALAGGLGTIVWPFSTMLFDHVPAGVAILAAFGLALAAADAERTTPGPGAGNRVAIAGAGVVAGVGVTVSYTVGIALVALGLYLLRARPRPSTAMLYGGGAAVPLGLLALYQWRAFGSPLAIPNQFQIALFGGGGGRLDGVFSLPDPRLAWQLLGAPARGLFVASPILLAAFAGLWLLWRRPARRREAVVIGAVFAGYFVLNLSFLNWHGGFSFGPRYLLPAVPLLCLPLASAFDRLPRTTSALAVLSVAVCLLATAVTPQIPPGVTRPVAGFLLPVAGGHTARVGAFAFDEPVGANPQGVYEALPYRLFARGSAEARGNSFNLGERLGLTELASLLPLLLLLAAGATAALRAARRAGR